MPKSADFCRGYDPRAARAQALMEVPVLRVCPPFSVESGALRPAALANLGRPPILSGGFHKCGRLAGKRNAFAGEGGPSGVAVATFPQAVSALGLS
mmetsp:Transcript_102619/g.290000  ORF Transcript_102619/g.290000 Transcript_102619/m.290000 type:complete len:96 (+) Transcript_102619:2713-3000(+)